MTRGKRSPDVRLRLAPGGSPTLLCGEDGAPSRLDIGQPRCPSLGQIERFHQQGSASRRCSVYVDSIQARAGSAAIMLAPFGSWWPAGEGSIDWPPVPCEIR